MCTVGLYKKLEVTFICHVLEQYLTWSKLNWHTTTLCSVANGHFAYGKTSTGHARLAIFTFFTIGHVAKEPSLHFDLLIFNDFSSSNHDDVGGKYF